MIQRLIDDVRTATGTAARQTVLIGAVAVSLFVTTGFLCAAAFIVVLQRFGLVQACLTGAAIFFIVTLLSAGSYFALRRRGRKHIEEAPKAAASNFMPDPMMLATGLQIARAIGFKRILPIVALGAVTLGVMAAKGLSSSDDEQDDAPTED